MSRLYGEKLINDRWKYKVLSDYNYIFRDKNNEFNYYKLYDVIGFEQVADDEFLVFDRVNYDDFRLTRYKFENNTKKVLFEEKIYGFEELNDNDLLLMYTTNSATKHVKGIYSIKENKYKNENNWLSMSQIYEYFTKDEDEDEEEKNKKILLSKYVDKHNEIIFTIDKETLKPNNLCYSTLRDSYINVSNEEDIEKLVNEDKLYSWNISQKFRALENKSIKEAKQKLMEFKKL